MTHYWRVRTRLPERFGEQCRVLVRGRMNSVLVEFADGFRVVTSRNYVRLLPKGDTDKRIVAAAFTPPGATDE